MIETRRAANMSDPRHSSRSRPQFHYLYGSTDLTSPASTIGSPTLDHEALLGEGLILTDNEEDTPTTSSQDLQQIVLTNGKDHRMLPLLPGFDIVDETSEFLLGPAPPPPPPKPWHATCCGSILTGDHPIGRVTRVVLVVTVATCMCTLVMVLSTSSTDSMGASGYRHGPRFDYIPFPVVDREEYNDPATNIVNPELFDPSLLFQGTSASSRTNRTVDPLLKVPFPTGAFWTNLVVEPTPDRGFSYPVVVYPYAFKWSETLLQASYPPLRRRVDKISIRDTFNPDVTFGSLEAAAKRHIMAFDSLSVTVRFFLSSGGYWETYMVQGSPYITNKYQDATPEIHALSIFSDVSCPFDATGNYKDGSSFDSNNGRKLKWGVCTPYDPLSTGDDSTYGLSILHGVQFLLQTQEGLTWMLFASEPIALSFDTRIRTTVTAAEKFSGVLRLALIPPRPGDGSSPLNGSAPLSVSSGLQRLIYHSPVYPTSGSVSWEFRTGTSQSSGVNGAMKAIGLSDAANSFTHRGNRPSNRIATLRFHFETMLMNANSAGSGGADLLMLSLPHHANSLPQDTMLASYKQFDLVYLCIKGAMTPVTGDAWAYDMPLITFGFDDVDTNPYAQKLQPSVRGLILESVQNDLNSVLPTLDENIYGFGKQVARLAQLAHIISVMDYSKSAQSNHTHNSTSGSTFSRTFSDAINKLHSLLVSFLNGQVSDYIVYDAKFGGIVTQNGLYNSEEDFGNGRYNDHHFHYGYILYACAIMGHMNSTFVTEYGDHVDALMYDIAHNGNQNSQTLDSVFFPLARHKSWYDGHSFATGLFPFGNGKSQESSSEAVNAYYGAYLWSMVREGAQDDPLFELTDFARLLLAMEVQGARTYWHLLPPEDVSNKTTVSRAALYNPGFLKNYMVGNLGMMDVTCSTWFGTASLYVHMINFMPVTAITSVLFNKSFVEREFNAALAPILADVEMAWRGYVIADQAIIDPSSAWKEAQNLASYELDSALSKSQVLYWISTRPGFNATVPSIDKSHSSRSDSPSKRKSEPDTKSKPNSQSTMCEDNQACANLGLTGFCCPTSKGSFLECCSAKKP